MKMGKCGIAVLLVALTASVGAYAKEKPYVYNDKLSKAMNMWLAAGMGYDIKDQKVPSDQVGHFLDTGTGQLLDTAMNVNILEAGGVSGSTSLGLGAALFVLNSMAPDKQPMRNSIWYWMDDTGQTADEAQEEFSRKVLSSVRKIIVDSGYETKSPDSVEGYYKDYDSAVYKKRRLTITQSPIWFKGENSLCPRINNGVGDISYCRINVKTRTPQKREFNAHGNKGSYWFFSSEDLVYFNNLEFIKYNVAADKISDEFKFNELNILNKLSIEMGEDFFIYAAPKMINLDEGRKLGMPLVINNGNQMAFITSKD